MGSGAHRRGAGIMLQKILVGQWAGQVRSFESLIQEFWPIPGWPLDWQAQLAGKRAEYQREVATA